MARNQWGKKQCQAFNARPLRQLIERQLMIALAPASIQLSLKASQQIESDRKQVERHHQQTIDRATYQSELSRRRYEEVDPSNRLVASELERRWEDALLEQCAAEEALNRLRQKQPSQLTPSELDRIESLSHDISELWKSESASGKDRQIILRALIEQVTVEVVGTTERMGVTIHWFGGFESQHKLIRSVGKFERLETADEIKTIVIQLKRRGYSHQRVANSLNKSGFLSTQGGPFTLPVISQLCRNFKRQGEDLETQAGFENHWTAANLSKHLKIPNSTISKWRARGWIKSQRNGQRWILSADPSELNRLRRLAEYKGVEHRKIPLEIKTPCQDQ